MQCAFFNWLHSRCLYFFNFIRYLTVIFTVFHDLCCSIIFQYLESVIFYVFFKIWNILTLFLQTFSSALVSFPWRTPMMWMLDLLILPWISDAVFLSFYFFLSLFVSVPHIGRLDHFCSLLQVYWLLPLSSLFCCSIHPRCWFTFCLSDFRYLF